MVLAEVANLLKTPPGRTAWNGKVDAFLRDRRRVHASH
jgi:hypothetical protein